MNTMRSGSRPRQVTTVVIGGGQAGLATSRYLTASDIDHVVLERGEVANSWRRERWDSLRLLTPNWQTRLPGYCYAGDDPEGYMTMPEVVNFLGAYARAGDAPLQCGTRVVAVRPDGVGYRVESTRGDWRCRTLVIASGAFNTPVVPAVAAGLPRHLYSLTPHQYSNPEQLPGGGVLVVGAAASGVQIAAEIQQSGRQVILACGEHVRMPRLYRGRDILYWMHATGMLDECHDEVEDIRRARRLPSAQLVGSPLKHDLDLNALMALGVEVVGRVAAVSGNTMQFSGSLANVAKLADLKQGRLLDSIDTWLESSGHGGEAPTPDRPEPTRVSPSSRLELRLDSGEISTVIWATGFRPDYSWLQLPVLDSRGWIWHRGGVTDAPGVYVMGLPFMRRRKSSFIFGVEDDARDICGHLAATLAGARHPGASRTNRDRVTAAG